MLLPNNVESLPNQIQIAMSDMRKGPFHFKCY